MLVDLPTTNDLIDVSSGDSNTPSQQQIFTNNNSLLVTTTGDSHENKGKYLNFCSRIVFQKLYCPIFSDLSLL